jgi:hypothetical protein
VRKCGVNDVGVRKTENKFPHRNARKKSSFAEEAVVCGSLKLK